MDCDVIIVGGGLAGTRAAAQIAAGGAEVVLLEARERLGGRTWTQDLHGLPIDLGAQFIGPGQPRMYDLVDRFGLALSATPTAGRHLLELDGRVSRYSGTIPFWNPLKLLKLYLNLFRLERLARQVPAEAPWESARAAALDGLTLADWQQRHAFRGREIEALGQSVLRAVLGAETSEISLLHFLGFVNSNGGLMPLVETHGGFQQDRIVGGTQQIAERLAADLPRGTVRLNEPVTGIRHDHNGVMISAASQTWRARRAVVAAPLATLGNIEFLPALPPDRHALQTRVTMGHTVKVFVAYREAFWRRQGLSGQAVGTSGWLSVVFDNTPPDGRIFALVGFVVGSAARDFVGLPLAHRRQEIVDELVGFFGEAAREPIAYEDTDWSSERFSGGCPTGLFNIDTLSRFGDTLRAPVGRVHWAGTETARHCMGYMEGAVESGDRVAAEVLARL